MPSSSVGCDDIPAHRLRGYLDEIADEVGEASRDRHPLDYLIQENALMKSARAAGYRVVGIGSNYSATERFRGVDTCVCEQYGLHEIERTAIALTPLAALSLDHWTYGAHRRKVLDSFEALERKAEDARTLTFALILTPHPPFVFEPDGSPRRPVGLFSFLDGDHYPGSHAEYVAGYAAQVQFLTRRLTAVIESLLSRPGPTPAIVLHGDHGPGSELRWEDPARTNLRERLGIFSAYLFPGEPGPVLSPTMSPVNGARTLARRYLGVDAPPLPDRSLFSTWHRPFDFVPVETVEAASRAAPAR
jgi:hypothetical protein